jgi:hypothetical protein
MNNFKLRCKVFWKNFKDNNISIDTKNVENYINECISKVEKDYDVYDFSITELWR